MRESTRTASHIMPRPGFTIVELLVVLAIMALLLVLVLPVVNNAREAMRRNGCQVNQTRLVLAISRFSIFNGRLPGWRNRFQLNQGVTHTYTLAAPNPPLTVDWLSASWAVTVLPQLGHADIQEQMKAKKRWSNNITGDLTGILLSEFLCPTTLSATTYQQYPYSVLNYGVNIAHNDSTDGVLVDRVLSPNDRTLEDIQGWDGLSNTFLVADAYFRAWPGGWGPAWHVPLYDPNNPANKYSEQKGNMLGVRGSVMNPVINNPSNAAIPLPQSAHPDGAVIAFCDGSTRLLRDTIAPHVWGHLSTSRSVFNGTNYLSTTPPGVNSTSANAWLMSGRTPAVEPYRLSQDDL